MTNSIQHLDNHFYPVNPSKNNEIQKKAKIIPVKLGNFPQFLTLVYRLFNETKPNGRNNYEKTKQSQFATFSIDKRAFQKKQTQTKANLDNATMKKQNEPKLTGPQPVILNGTCPVGMGVKDLNVQNEPNYPHFQSKNAVFRKNEPKSKPKPEHNRIQGNFCGYHVNKRLLLNRFFDKI